MNHTTRREATDAVKEPIMIEELSVYRACERIADGRAKRGVRYSVAFVLTVIL